MLAVPQFKCKQVPDDLSIEPAMLLTVEVQNPIIEGRLEVSALTRVRIAEDILNQFVQLPILK